MRSISQWGSAAKLGLAGVAALALGLVVVVPASAEAPFEEVVLTAEPTGSGDPDAVPPTCVLKSYQPELSGDHMTGRAEVTCSEPAIGIGLTAWLRTNGAVVSESLGDYTDTPGTYVDYTSTDGRSCTGDGDARSWVTKASVLVDFADWRIAESDALSPSATSTCVSG